MTPELRDRIMSEWGTADRALRNIQLLANGKDPEPYVIRLSCGLVRWNGTAWEHECEAAR